MNVTTPSFNADHRNAATQSTIINSVAAVLMFFAGWLIPLQDSAAQTPMLSASSQSSAVSTGAENPVLSASAQIPAVDLSAQVPSLGASSATANKVTKGNPVQGSIQSGNFSALDWNALIPSQQVALKPLTNSWKNLSDPQKRKWISLSANFFQMSAADQTKLHERMVQWAALSTKQREQARLNFAEAKKLQPQQKSEKWQAYQALSAEEKERLAKSAQPKPPRTALAAQPAPPGRLNLMPTSKNAGHIGIAASAATLSSNKTLLTRPTPPKPPRPPQPPASDAPSKP